MQLQDHLYTQTTVAGVLDEYIKELLETGNTESVMHANKLKSYQNMIKDKQYIKDLRKLFNETYDMIEKKHPELQFSIAGRRKSLISVEKKILQYSALGKSLDLIRDFYAYRIILFGNDDTVGLVEHCYKVIGDIIDFVATKGFSPCERLPLLGVTDLKEHKSPYFSPFKYKQYVKDYICFPKENGYRSIHLVLVDTKGRYLEIQIRTLEMHAQIQSSDLANHSNYKEKKYNISFPLERDKISIYGYSYVNNQVFDYAGVEEPITIFQRQKTF